MRQSVSSHRHIFMTQKIGDSLWTIDIRTHIRQTNSVVISVVGRGWRWRWPSCGTERAWSTRTFWWKAILPTTIAVNNFAEISRKIAVCYSGKTRNSSEQQRSSTYESKNISSQVWWHPSYSPDLAPCGFFLFPQAEGTPQGTLLRVSWWSSSIFAYLVAGDSLKLPLNRMKQLTRC